MQAHEVVFSRKTIKANHFLTFWQYTNCSNKLPKILKNSIGQQTALDEHLDQAYNESFKNRLECIQHKSALTISGAIKETSSNKLNKN